ncbi:nuclear RNA export factor 1-like [Homarus americanus]|uniref:nuclear RNA export factor 1-like n=1 Tax=Homarus americanus TaxID=6706 RepID=UPI001C4921DE|nr:nuclear RNA export factor 1-like [Homarus americanus]
MGRRKSRQKVHKQGELFAVHDEMMALDIGSGERPKSAKQSSKLRKKIKKQLKREMKQMEQMGKHGEKGKAKISGWHRIQVQGGATVEKDFLFSSIGNFVDVEFQPLGFYMIDSTSCFYLEANEPAAAAIAGLNKRIQGSDGSRLKISALKSIVPDLVLNSDQLQVLREVMSRRFNPTACLLDLTDLHHDPVLLEKDILVPVCSPVVMKQVLRLIKENVPQLKALNLSKNHLRVGNLKLLQDIHSDTTQLSALNLERNNIADLHGILKFIKMFPLTELNLQFNPLINQYKENPLKYVLAVKKQLESLKMLDTVDVDTYIAENKMSKNNKNSESSPRLDVCESTSSSSSNIMSEVMIRNFLEQYYALIDTQQRDNLVAAYTPDAVLQVKSSLSEITSNIFVGHSKITEALSALPATQHQHNSFSLNIQFPSVNTALAVVTGHCQVSGVDTAVTFSRSMNIVPFNAGLCCSQDVLELR